MRVALSGLRREERLLAMAADEVDLLVIGGGITGSGIALDAASRGLRTALVEMQDFAAGTSSRSTKLIHGGLRYLKQYEFGVVAEVGKERAVVYENGPHVTTPEWMLLPLYEGGSFSPFLTSVGLRIYDWLAGVKKRERRKMLTVAETLVKEPLLKQEGLKGSGYYVEYRTDDARLTIEVLKKAAEVGALAVNYAEVDTFMYQDNRQIGAVVHDLLGDARHEIRARQIVNAAGPWVDQLRELDQSKRGKTLRLTKGVHLVFNQQRFPLRQAIYFDTADRRMVFAIPRDGRTYVGTTDTDYSGDMANPVMTVQDRAYLLAVVNETFPSVRLTEADVESSWSGLRPLIGQEGKNPSEISRRDEIFVSPSGMLSVAGGKLTGYRKMAEAVVDRVMSVVTNEGGQQVSSISQTKHMPISGGDVGGSKGFVSYVEQLTAQGMISGLDRKDAERMARRYGSNAPLLYELAAQSKGLAETYRLPLALVVELRYAIEEEGAAKPEDFWVRRTGSLYFDIAKVEQYGNGVLSIMSELLGWDERLRVRYESELNGLVHDAVTPATYSG